MFKSSVKRVVDERKPFNDSKEFMCVVDQFDAQDFNQNEAGHIRNSISQLARAQSQSEYDSIMKRLVEIQKSEGIKEGTTVEEAISMIKPRYLQSPNEIEQFIEFTNGDIMSKVHDAYNKALERDKSADASLQPVGDSVSTNASTSAE